jgi:hypothetical protein
LVQECLLRKENVSGKFHFKAHYNITGHNPQHRVTGRQAVLPFWSGAVGGYIFSPSFKRLFNNMIYMRHAPTPALPKAYFLFLLFPRFAFSKRIMCVLSFAQQLISIVVA